MLDRLAAIPFDWDTYLNTISGGLFTGTDMPDKTKLFQNLAQWNNQPKHWETGKGMPTTKPCCYVQPVFGKATKLGLGVTLYPDFIFKVHIIDWQKDGFNEAGGTDGTNELIGGLDQNLEIYHWRDLVKVQLQLFFPKNCGALTIIDEEEDIDHLNLNHYILSFKTSFSDLQGSILNPDQTQVIYVDPPQPAGQFGFDPTINLVDVIPTE